MPINEQLLQEIKEFSDKKLSLKEWELNDNDIEELIPALQSNPHIKELDLSLNYITAVGAKLLLTNLPNIEVLKLQGNDIGPDINDSLDLSKCKLKILDISSNLIGDAVDVFANIPTLTELNASECEITDVGACNLFLSKSIEQLDLTTNNISGTSFEKLTDNHVLKKLYLAQNSISADNLKYLIENNTLTTLDLTSTWIGNQGAAHLSKNKYLKELWVSQCFIGDDGAKALALNKNLEKLVLLRNKINNAGAIKLINNHFILSLNLQDNPCYNTIDLDFLKEQHYTRTFDGAFVRTKEQHPSIVKDKRRSSILSIVFK